LFDIRYFFLCHVPVAGILALDGLKVSPNNDKERVYLPTFHPGSE
jgi:hypothetical protein